MQRMTLNGVRGFIDPVTGRFYPIIAGGSPEEEAGGEGGGSGEGGSGGSGGNEENEDEGNEDEETTVSKSELEELRKAEKELQRTKHAAAQAEKRRRREHQDEQKKKGEWDEVVKGLEEERDTALRERDKAIADLDEVNQRQVVDAIAERRHWKSPRDAFLFLSPEARSEDERVIERALKTIETERPYLINPAPPSGLPINDGKKRTPASDMNARIRRATGRL